MDLILPLLSGLAVGLGLKWQLLRSERQGMVVKLAALALGVVALFFGPSLSFKKGAIVFVVSLIVGTFLRRTE